MQSQRLVESLVGLFLVFALASLTVLAFKVSGLTSLFPEKSYEVSATFDDIGGLKVRAPVKISGVQIGEVESIKLDPITFKAVVKLSIRDKFSGIPDDSSAGILTAGLLGDNYVEITPMYGQTNLQNGGKIQFTRPAMILEKIIGQVIYKISNSSGNNNDTTNGGSNAKPN